MIKLLNELKLPLLKGFEIIGGLLLPGVSTVRAEVPATLKDALSDPQSLRHSTGVPNNTTAQHNYVNLRITNHY